MIRGLTIFAIPFSTLILLLPACSIVNKDLVKSESEMFDSLGISGTNQEIEKKLNLYLYKKNCIQKKVFFKQSIPLNIKEICIHMI